MENEKEKITGSSSCHGSVFPSLPNGNRINPTNASTPLVAKTVKY